MARRPAGSARWLREALLARREALVARFECPTTRVNLANYRARLMAGEELDLTRDDLFLALYAVDPRLADQFGHPTAGRSYMLTEDNQLRPLDG